MLTRMGMRVLLSVGLVAASLCLTGCPVRNAATLRVVNQGDLNITAVYCTPSWDDFWGDNLISTPIAPGASRDITGFDPDDYDMKAVFSDDTEIRNDDAVFAANAIYTWNVDNDGGTTAKVAAPRPDGIDIYVPLTPEESAATSPK